MEDNMPITMPVNGMNFPAGDFKQGMPMMENGMQQMPFNGMQQPPMGNMQMNTQMRMPQMPMFNQGSGNMNKGPSFNKEGEDSSKFMHQGPGQMNQGNQMMPMMNGMQGGGQNSMQTDPNLQKLLNMNFDSGDHITSEQRTKLQAQLKKLQKALAKVDSDLAKAVKKIEKEVAKQQKNLSAQLAKAQKMLAAASTDTDKTQIQSYIDQLNEFKIPSVEDRKADLLEMAEQKKSDIQDAIDEINDYLESADSSEE
jgi:vacuolar-type H+-ATPase subunit I/STV1